MDTGRVAENAREPFEHAIGATDRSSLLFVPRSESGIGLVQPGRQPDAAGHAVEFCDGKAAVRQQQVRTDHARQIVFEGWGALQFDQFSRLASIQPVRHPGRLLSGDALAIEQVDRAIELEQNAPERFEFLGQFRADGEGRWRSPPVHVGEQSAGGEGIADEF